MKVKNIEFQYRNKANFKLSRLGSSFASCTKSFTHGALQKDERYIIKKNQLAITDVCEADGGKYRISFCMHGDDPLHFDR